MRKSIPSILVLMTGGLALLLTAAILVAVGASPARADDLPPRPTAVPTATPAPDDGDAGSLPYGATITLRVTDAPATAWTIVQWQDALGGWHDVDGWRGRLDDGDGDEKIWWVAPKDFATGPFRWQVYAQRDGALVASSDSFTLPAHTGATLLVEVDAMP